MKKIQGKLSIFINHRKQIIDQVKSIFTIKQSKKKKIDFQSSKERMRFIEQNILKITNVTLQDRIEMVRNDLSSLFDYFSFQDQKFFDRLKEGIKRLLVRALKGKKSEADLYCRCSGFPAYIRREKKRFDKSPYDYLRSVIKLNIIKKIPKEFEESDLEEKMVEKIRRDFNVISKEIHDKKKEMISRCKRDCPNK